MVSCASLSACLYSRRFTLARLADSTRNRDMSFFMLVWPQICVFRSISALSASVCGLSARAKEACCRLRIGAFERSSKQVPKRRCRMEFHVVGWVSYARAGSFEVLGDMSRGGVVGRSVPALVPPWPQPGFRGDFSPRPISARSDPVRLGVSQAGRTGLRSTNIVRLHSAPRYRSTMIYKRQAARSMLAMSAQLGQIKPRDVLQRTVAASCEALWQVVAQFALRGADRQARDRSRRCMDAMNDASAWECVPNSRNF